MCNLETSSLSALSLCGDSYTSERVGFSGHTTLASVDLQVIFIFPFLLNVFAFIKLNFKKYLIVESM